MAAGGVKTRFKGMGWGDPALPKTRKKLVARRGVTGRGRAEWGGVVLPGAGKLKQSSSHTLELEMRAGLARLASGSVWPGLESKMGFRCEGPALVPSFAA